MDSKNPSGAKSRAEVYDWIQCIIFALVFCVVLFHCRLLSGVDSAVLG